MYPGMKILVVLFPLCTHTVTPSAVPVNVNGIYLHDKQKVSVQGMAAAELWLLCIFRGKLVSNAVKQLDVALLGVLLQGVDERP